MVLSRAVFSHVILAKSSDSRKRWKEAERAGKLRRMRADMVLGARDVDAGARRALAAELRDVSEVARKLAASLEAAAAPDVVCIDWSSSDDDDFRIT